MNNLFALFEIFFGITKNQFKEKDTIEFIDIKRHMLVYVASIRLQMKSIDIAKELGRSSHACVNNSLKQVEKLLFTDKKFKEDIELIELFF